MKRKSMAAIATSFTLAASMLAGCGNKQAEVKETASAETSKVTFDTTTIGNVIVNDPVKLSDLLYGVKLEKGQSVTEASFSYGSETVKLETGKEPKTDTKVFVAIKDKAFKEFTDKNNVPNAILTFLSASKTPADLKVDLSLSDKEKQTSDASVSIKVRVLPETVKPVKAITQNLKLSQDLKDYDFDVRAKNIADKVPDAVNSIKVKKSNVKFGKAGHYEVTYDIKTKPDDTIEVTTDVEILDKKAEGDTPKDSVITDSKDTTANTDSNASSGNAVPSDSSSASGSSNSSDSNTSSSSGNSNASSGGGSSAPGHTHNWKAHTATKQVWVPNIVTVTDYGTEAAHRCDSRCSGCGALFGSPEECSDHQFATGHGGRQNIACTHTKQVVTGSHTEDHGHNETQSYTDYYYCDCGATK